MERIELDEYAANPRSASPSTSTARDDRAMAATSEVVEIGPAPLPQSGAEEAGHLFWEEVGRLPGVLQVERWGPGAIETEGSPSSVPSFYVYVKPEDRETEYAIYEVQGRVYDRFPETYLEVVVLQRTDAPALAAEASPVA